MAIPVGMTDRQLTAYGATRPVNGRGRHYPGVYNNEEENPATQGIRPNFHDWETRGNMLAEFPATNNAPYDFNRRAANLNRVRNVENQFERNRRGIHARQPLNDPGPARYVARTDVDGNLYNVVGAMYHPEGNARGFNRAPLAPIERQGRRDMARYADDHNGTNRMSTWPPRDQDAADLTRREANYRRVRR